MVLAEVRRVSHRFTLPTGKSVDALADINVQVRADEILAVIGPSGCGKSTLLRLVAGLMTPTSGEVFDHGQLLQGLNPGVAVVFQGFALYPWLTVAKNIEVALESKGLSEAQRHARVSEVISLVGLEGFEEAYPRELSVGMKQRVGIARALALDPEILCMDEPFSQVDALTAENLRSEVVNLWLDRERNPKSIFLVSHDVQEVLFLASRIMIMGTNPSSVRQVIENPLSYPRDVRSPEFRALADRLREIITGILMPEMPTIATAAAEEAFVGTMPLDQATTAPGVVEPLPRAGAREILGLLRAIESRGGEVALFQLTSEISQALGRLLQTIKAAELLGFVDTPHHRIVLTELGRQVLKERKRRKAIFQQQLRTLRLVQHVVHMIERSPAQRLPTDVLLEEFAILLPQEDPRRMLRILLNWGRFADLFDGQRAEGFVCLGPAKKAANGKDQLLPRDVPPPPSPPSSV